MEFDDFVGQEVYIEWECSLRYFFDHMEALENKKFKVAKLNIVWLEGIKAYRREA